MSASKNIWSTLALLKQNPVSTIPWLSCVTDDDLIKPVDCCDIWENVFYCIEGMYSKGYLIISLFIFN